MIKVACGSNHAGVLLSNGQVLMFGSNRQGQLGLQTQPRTFLAKPTPLSLSIRVRDIALGDEHSLLLSQEDLRVYSFGQNAEGQLGLGKNSKLLSTSSPSLIAELTVHKILRVAACGNTSAAYSDRGHLFVWGLGIWGTFFDANRVRGFGTGAESDIQIADFGVGKNSFIWVKDT